MSGFAIHEVRAQGYSGLFADEGAPEQPSAPAGGDYGGVLAPSGNAPANVPPAPAPAAPSTNTVLAPAAPAGNTAASSNYGGNFTPIQQRDLPTSTAMGAQMPAKVQTADDLKRLATAYSIDKNFDGIPDNIAAAVKLPATMTEMLKQPRVRINGMLPMESTVKTSIDKAMASLRDPKLSAVQRQENLKTTLTSLRTMRSGLKAKSTVSDTAYRLMGMPDLYVKEERESITKSLARVEAALAALE